jgi:hypothetical protein
LRLAPRDDRGYRRAGDPTANDSLRNLRNLGTSAVVILPGPSRTAAFAVDLAAPAPSPSRTRAIRRENSAVAAAGYLIRQQGQSCEGQSQ